MEKPVQKPRSTPCASPVGSPPGLADAATRKVLAKRPSVDAISIESDSDSTESLPLDKLAAEAQFQSEISRLKQKSTSKFKSSWEDIIRRYSAVDDATESDEIDLSSGQITVDNGHLSSLRQYSHKPDVWSLEYDAERDSETARRKEKRLLVRKSMLKAKLKADQRFFNDSVKEKSITPERKLSPMRDVSPDNILLLNPSPTKKFKGSVVVLSDSEAELQEPGEGRDQEVAEADSGERVYGTEEAACVELEKQNGNEEQEPSESDAVQDRVTSNGSETAQSQYASHVDRLKNAHRSNSIIEVSESEDSDSHSFDDSFSIVNASPVSLIEAPTILECCLKGCQYCTGNKNLFRQHLLKSHSTELYAVGYPIAEAHIDRKKKVVITKEVVDKLDSVFPIVHEVPALPLSGSGDTFRCEAPVGDNFCQKEFVSSAALKHHRARIPHECSSRKQVYICPLLGCGFMTDEGYIQWRSHFLERKHHIRQHRVPLTTTILPPPRPNFSLTENRHDTCNSASSRTKDQQNENKTDHKTPSAVLTSSSMPKSTKHSKIDLIKQELDLFFNDD